MIYNNNNVLVIDDSITIRHQLKLLLKKHDLTVFEASDKKTLLHYIKADEINIDLFIVDLGLKFESGMDLMQLIRSYEAYSDTPIIVLTGDSKRETLFQCVRYHISFYSVKPIDAKDLSMKVLTALDAYNIKKRLQHVAYTHPDAPFVGDLDLNNIDVALKNTNMSKINKLIESDYSTFKKTINPKLDKPKN